MLSRASFVDQSALGRVDDFSILSLVSTFFHVYCCVLSRNCFFMQLEDWFDTCSFEKTLRHVCTVWRLSNGADCCKLKTSLLACWSTN